MENQNSALINDFLGSSHAFSATVARLIEEGLWSEVAGKRLSMTQLRLLKLVSLPGDMHTIGDVATFLEVSSAAASKAVEKLVREMLIERRQAESDRRAIHLSLTGAGRRLLESYDAAARQKLAEVFEQVAPEEISFVVKLLDRLSSSMMDRRQAGNVCVHCGIYFRDRCYIRKHLGWRCLHIQGTARSGDHAEPGNRC